MANDRKVTTGQKLKIPASTWNELLETNADYQERRRLGVANPPRPQPLPSDLVKLRNDSGGDLTVGSVLATEDVLLDEQRRGYPWFEGHTPAAGSVTYAVLLRPLADSEIGDAQAAGVALARVNIGNTSHRYCAPAVGSHVLTSGNSGPIKLLSPASSTGEELHWVLLPPVEEAPKRLQAQACDAFDANTFSVEVKNLTVIGSLATAPAVTSAENMLGKAAAADDILILELKGGSTTDWYIQDVEYHPVCMVNKVWDSPTGLAYGGVQISAMFGTVPTEGCIIIGYDDCEDEDGSGSGSGSGSAEDLSFELIVTCCGTSESAGSGSCGSGSGA